MKTKHEQNIVKGGHLKKPQEAVHVENAKRNFNFWKFIKHQVPYHVLYMKKVIFSREMITKKEQNAVKSGLNIIPIGDVKMR